MTQNPTSGSGTRPEEATDPGGRGADLARQDARRLVFSTAPVEVALNVRERVRDSRVDVDGRLSINGKYFPRRDIPVDGFNVQLLQGASAIADTTTDHLGEFAFQAVTPGRYSVRFHTRRLGIMIRPVKLGVLGA